MKSLLCVFALMVSFVLSATALAADDPMATASLDELLAQGEAFYNKPVSCWVCHGEKGEGRVGPSLENGADAAMIWQQIQTNPQMGIIASELKPSDADLVAVSLYIRKLVGLPVDKSLYDEQMMALTKLKSMQVEEVVNVLTARDLEVQRVETFQSVLDDWQRKAKTGSLVRNYQSRVVTTFEPGKVRFEPEPDHTYFYENIGNASNPSVLPEGFKNAKSSQVVVGDAESKEVLAHYMIPAELRAAVHTTAMSPDGKFVYIVGSKEGDAYTKETLGTSATVLKVDALTLQPVKQFTIGGRFHHGQVFQDRYMLFDTFARDPDGLDIMLFDPQTDEVLGGIRDEDLGGATYTAFTDNKSIFVLMEPTGYAPGSSTGMTAIRNMYAGKLVAMRPFWVARIDPKTWEVVQEYPLPGFRPNWIAIDSASEYMYVTQAGSSNLSKINIETGEMAWTAGTGIGPYGANLNADETEIWIADKGEGTGHFGRTITVLNAITGQVLETIFSGYQVDHVLLSPDGKEMWATSNGEGRIFIFDAETRERTKVIDMPDFGDPHGLVWVRYDEHGNSKVIRDQGGFHNGVNPVRKSTRPTTENQNAGH
jgi:DNA-binding beta-propeller fold protein YncE/mono/diheme cytochrome c family protein